MAEGQFGQQVTVRVSLEEKAARMARDAAARGAVKGARIRALYMAGGGAALYASVLNSDNLADAVHQSAVMQYVFGGDRAGQRTDDAAVRRLAAAQAAAQRATARLALRSRQLAVLADHVQELLGRQQELVAAADTQVLGLVRQQQADAAAAAADKFAADLAAAQTAQAAQAAQAGQAAQISAGDAPAPSEVAPPAPGPNPGATRPSDGAGQAARTTASDAPGISEVAPPAPGPNPGAARPSDGAGQAARTTASDAPGISEVAPPAPGPNPGAARPSDPIQGHAPGRSRGPAVDAPGVPPAGTAMVLAVAKQQLGKPYVWGAVGPDSFDCSGFTGYAYAAAGIALPRTAAQQYLTGSHPSLAQLTPGDLLFWATDPSNYASIEHMAMYLGNGLMIAAPHTGDVVKIERVYSTGYFGATRVDPAVSGRVDGPQWSDVRR